MGTCEYVEATLLPARGVINPLVSGRCVPTFYGHIALESKLNMLFSPDYGLKYIFLNVSMEKTCHKLAGTLKKMPSE